MGKGYNNFMSKKPFHPASKDNIKRVWMAEQRSIDEKKKEDNMRLQYEKEQDLYNNRVLVAGSDSKDKLSLNFMYEAPAGIKRTEKEADLTEPEYKFEWQRNAPRESFAKNNMDIRDQPFGIQVRNVRCLKCHKWGHVNTDRECPLFNAGSLCEQQPTEPAPTKNNDGTDKPPPSKSEQSELIQNMKDEQGLALKKSLYGSYGAKRRDGDISNQKMLSVKDPEVAFLDSLTAKEKKKLLKRLQKITNAQRGIKEGKGDKKSKKSKKSKDKKKSSKKRKHEEDSSDSGQESEGDRHHGRHRSPSRSASPPRRRDSPARNGHRRERSPGPQGRPVRGHSPVRRRDSRSPRPPPRDTRRPAVRQSRSRSPVNNTRGRAPRVNRSRSPARPSRRSPSPVRRTRAASRSPPSRRQPNRSPVTRRSKSSSRSPPRGASNRSNAAFQRGSPPRTAYSSTNRKYRY